MPTKVTVIGCGAVVQTLYRSGLRRLEKEGMIRVVRLVDRDLGRAQRLARDFGDALACDDPLDALQGSQLAIVATPAPLHHSHTIAALSHGNHVLCEKPMAVTADQCREMNQAARSRHLKLSVGMIRRYYPSLVQARKIIESGAVGRVVSFCCREGRQYNWPVASPETLKKQGAGRGILLDVGAHVLDTLVWLFGTPRVVSCRDDSLKNGIEASCLAELDFGGIRGSVHMSWDYDLVNRLEITGTAGKITVSLDGIDSIAAVSSDGRPLPAPEVSFQVLLKDARMKSFYPRTIPDLVYLHLSRFLDAIGKDERPGIDGEEGLAVISAIESCYGMAGPIDMDWLPAQQNRSFQNLHWRKRT